MEAATGNSCSALDILPWQDGVPTAPTIAVRRASAALTEIEERPARPVELGGDVRDIGVEGAGLGAAIASRMAVTRVTVKHSHLR